MRSTIDHLSSPEPAQFTFYTGVDHEGGNPGENQIDAGSANVLCSNDTNCSGFNSEGFLRTKIDPIFLAPRIRFSGPCDGIYIKNGETLYSAFKHNGEFSMDNSQSIGNIKCMSTVLFSCPLNTIQVVTLYVFEVANFPSLSTYLVPGSVLLHVQTALGLE